MPNSTWSFFCHQLCFCLLAACVTFGWIVVAGAIIERSFTTLILGFLALGLLSGGVSCCFAAASAFAYKMSRPVIEVAGAKLTVRLGDNWSREYRLEDCAWYSGRLSNVVIRKVMLPLSREAVVVIALPGSEESGVWTVPVGFTNESRERWIERLTHGKAIHWASRERPLSRCARLANAVAIVFGVPVFFLGGVMASRLLKFTLQWSGLSQGLADILAFVTWLPGTLFLLAYAGLFWPFRALKRIPSWQPSVEQRKRFHKIFWAALVLTLFNFGLPIWLLMGNQLVIGEKAVSLAYLLLMTTVCTYDLARRISTTERESVESLHRASNRHGKDTSTPGSVE